MTEEYNHIDPEKVAEIQKINGEMQKIMNRSRLYFYIEVVVSVIIVVTLIYLIFAP